MADTARRKNQTRSADAHAAPAAGWEYVVAALGALLVLATLVYLGYVAATRDNGPPRIAVERLATLPNPPGYVVTIRVLNRSAATAAELVVRGELRADGQVVEEAEVTLDFVAGHSQRQAGLFFARDPRGLELRLQPKSYREP